MARAFYRDLRRARRFVRPRAMVYGVTIRTGPTDDRGTEVRDAEDQPLGDRVEEDAHEHEVRHARHARLRELAPGAAVQREALEIRRPTGARVAETAPDAEDDGEQGLEDEAQSPGAREPRGDVLEEGAREQIDPAPIVRVTQRARCRDREDDERQPGERERRPSTVHGGRLGTAPSTAINASGRRSPGPRPSTRYCRARRERCSRAPAACSATPPAAREGQP